MSERCDSCRLWRRLTAESGTCHALPAAPVLYDPGLPASLPPPGGWRVAWPRTDASEFCGEWSPMPVRPQRPDRPRKVCLVGSSRFKDAHEKAMREETLAGRIVLPMGLYGHLEGLDMAGPVKATLDALHLAKIDEADEVLVVNPVATLCDRCGKPSHATTAGTSGCCGGFWTRGPYVGESTRREIAYAEAAGKPVRYLEPPEGGQTP